MKKIFGYVLLTQEEYDQIQDTLLHHETTFREHLARLRHLERLENGYDRRFDYMMNQISGLGGSLTLLLDEQENIRERLYPPRDEKGRFVKR